MTTIKSNLDLVEKIYAQTPLERVLNGQIPGAPVETQIPLETSPNKKIGSDKGNKPNTVFVFHKDSRMRDQIISKQSSPQSNNNGRSDSKEHDDSSSYHWSLRQLATHSCDIVVFQMSPRQVKVKFAFLTVGDVDTKSQRFVTEVLIQAKWVEPKLQGLTDVSYILFCIFKLLTKIYLNKYEIAVFYCIITYNNFDI